MCHPVTESHPFNHHQTSSKPPTQLTCTPPRLFHFALFISACRYTHDRRHATTTRQARAITAEATEIARRMIADMTGPNGTFIPKNQTLQTASYQPLQQSDKGETMEMRQQQQQQQSRSQPSGYDYQPVQQGEALEEEGSSHQPHSSSREDAMRRRLSPGSPLRESMSAAVVGRSSNPRDGRGPNGEMHPAFRDDPNVIAHAI